ncbi:Type 1 glutamine amidotransferase-like domain-containing protein [Chryseobacterium sp. CKR4-1]|uniref:Type 1 glutamine amidotransferase-like domain-containing protein n=1 Tax=Chryseobacterium sp. CKR4-1 TaxID=3068896 RepID=UPI002796D8A5|nr:Type 1 glutamine amidotransferase-like domain-containing protein [Chryseobacterium sp. CKR4-1]MDQ1806133.1 Type 1 glutamine amidotransferase-like domain-containing protein [Chryseobacterium sp. CKR4-1]
MNPKGRLIIMRGADMGIFHDAKNEVTSPDFPSEIFSFLPEEKDSRLEILTTSNSGGCANERLIKMLQAEGYSNFGIINVQHTEDFHNYYTKISEAKVVFLAGGEPEIWKMMKRSAIMELLLKRYHDEEDFTIVGIDAGAMCISRVILSEGGTGTGLGFIHNCIIDTKFQHGERCKGLVKAIIANKECLGIGLNRGMALIIDKGYKVSCLGKGTVMVVNARNIKNRRLKAGASVYAKNLQGHILTGGATLNLFSGNRIKDDLLHYNLNFINRNNIQ